MNENEVQNLRKSAICILRRVRTLKRECRGKKADFYKVLACRQESGEPTKCKNN